MQQETFVHERGARDFNALVERVGWVAARAVLEARNKKSGGSVTLRDFTARYLDPKSGLLTGIEQGTRDGYAAEAQRSFLQTLGDIPVDLVTRADIGAWLSWQEEQPVHRDRLKAPQDQQRVSAKTVRNYHALLSSVLKSAVAEGLREDNPAHKIRIKRGTKRENVFLSPEEFATLLLFIPERYKRFVMFLAGTGCRWGEATAITWGDVAFHADPPTVRITRAWKRSKGRPILAYPKTSRSLRSVSLFPDLVEAMGDVGEPDEYVFPNMWGGNISHAHFRSRAWLPAVEKAMDKEACAAIGVKALTRAPTIHDLRHTHASWLIARGVPLPYVQARLGHESITTTVNVYGHLVSDAHQQMASAIASTMTGVRSPLSIEQNAETLTVIDVTANADT